MFLGSPSRPHLVLRVSCVTLEFEPTPNLPISFLISSYPAVFCIPPVLRRPWWITFHCFTLNKVLDRPVRPRKFTAFTRARSRTWEGVPFTENLVRRSRRSLVDSFLICWDGTYRSHERLPVHTWIPSCEFLMTCPKYKELPQQPRA